MSSGVSYTRSERPPLRIGIAQTRITSDAASNGAEMRRLLRVAAGSGARLVQFPEGALSGYAKEQIRSWDDVDWGVVRSELARIADLAGELGIWTVVGSAHPLTPPNRPCNSLFVISDGGRIVYRYDKRLCSHTEITEYFSPGFDRTVFDVDGYRFGCAICVEVHYPEIFAEYERLGVDCVLLSAYPVAPIFEIEAQAHAATNCFWVGLSVPQQTLDLFTGSLIGPDGHRVASAETHDDLILADITPADPELQVALVHARPWRALARAGAIYEAHRVDDPRSLSPAVPGSNGRVT